MARTSIIRTRTAGEVEIYPLKSMSSWKSAAVATVNGSTFIRTKTGRVFSDFFRNGGGYYVIISAGRERDLIAGLTLVGALDKSLYADCLARLSELADKDALARAASAGRRYLEAMPGFKFTDAQLRALAKIESAPKDSPDFPS